MKITFQNTTEVKTELMDTKATGREKSTVSMKNTKAAGWRVDFMSKQDKNLSVQNTFSEEKKKGFSEFVQGIENQDLSVKQDYMTLMSHTLSEEDYAKLEKDGFKIEYMKPEDVVTIVDKIKAELIKSGQNIVGYTDTISKEALTQAVGSEALANNLTKEMEKADLPLTDENINDITKAKQMASELKEPTEGVYRYMVENGLEPEIFNFYLAQSSGASLGEGGQSGYYALDIKGYYSQSANSTTGSENMDLWAQTQKALEGMGKEVSEENMQQAKWLMDLGIPLTQENLDCLLDARAVSFPISDEVFTKSVVNAIAQGKNPIEANLTDTETLYEKAERILQSIGDRKELEQARLHMTAQVNMKLLESDFSLDTASIEEVLEAVEWAERTVAGQYFPEDNGAVEKYRLFEETCEIVKEMPTLPAQTLSVFIPKVGENSEGDITLLSFHKEGKALQEALKQAQTQYETLMTAPRADLGDSIKKAFRNVDDLLEGMNLELSEENRKAVRILGYSNTPVTAENVEVMKQADERVASLVRRMTPAATLDMIRAGVNPLENSFEQIEEYLDKRPGEVYGEEEKYSRFIYNLEKRGDITAEEKESFIGIYRMLRQIEKSDSAVIGTLVSSNAELNFSNLISSIRSQKFGHMDVKADDSLGMLESVLLKSDSIASQITKGFINRAKDSITNIAESDETQTSYRKEQVETLRELAEAGENEDVILEKANLPKTADNIFAAMGLTKAQNNPFDKWKGRMNIQRVELVKKMESKEEFTQAVNDFYEDAIEDLQNAIFDNTTDYVDVREMRLVHKQLTVAKNLAQKEEYVMPMVVGGEVTKVHLSFERDEKEKGQIRIRVNLSEEEQIEAFLEMKDNELSGFLIGNTSEEVMKLKDVSDIFTKSLAREEKDVHIGALPIVNAKPKASVVKKDSKDGTAAAGGPDNAQLYRIAGIFLEAIR